uniref:Sperm tail PG-rich repeat containing 2 n=1 Tax=Latimeria chalumnae TaxID=7897 RepID=M3XJK7_LATCH
MQNRAKRFQQHISDVPGPGSYEFPVCVEVGTKDSRPKQQKIPCRRVMYLRKSEAPSIPSPGQAHGYEEAEDGSLSRQLPPPQDVTLGPAYYKPQNYETHVTKKYKGIHFGNMTAKRSDFKIQEVPGPGAYDPSPDSTLNYENVNLKREDKKKDESFIPRYHEVLVLQEKKKDVPGPGKYDIKGQFEKKSNMIHEGVEVQQPPFLSQSKRFASLKSITPAPGAYDDPRTAFQSLKKTSGYNRTPFSQTSVRFLPESKLRKTPGPGAYNLVNYSLAEQSQKKVYLESARKGAFGTSSPRLQTFVKNNTLTPGPADYKIKSKLDEDYKQQQSSVFASGTDRLSTPTIGKVRALGYYCIRNLHYLIGMRDT